MPQINKKSLKKAVKFFFGIPLTLFSFYFIFASILSSSNDIVPKISHANIFSLITGLLLISAFFFLKSVVWNMILKNLGHEISFKKSFFLLQYGEIKRYIPGNIFSFVARVQYFKEFNIPTKTTVKGLGIEALLLVLSSIVVSIPSGIYFFSLFKSRFPAYFSLMDKIYILLPSVVLALSIIIIILRLKRLSPGFILRQISLYWDAFFVFVLAWVLFGIGNYFVASSFGTLSISLFLQILSLFVLSWLIGYLSFITPMGLGVREGVLTLGLSQIMPFFVASLLSLVLRIAFIIGELFVFLLSYILIKINPLQQVSFLKKISNESVLLILAISCYIIYFIYIPFEKYSNFYTGRFDLGNMDQTVWNTIHGNIFMITNPDGTNIMSRLGFHADFILILLSPFYLVWSDPRMLLIIQTVILSLGSVFVYLLSKDVIRSRKIALLLSFGYLLSPLVERINLFDFHPVALALTFLLATFYFLEKKRYVWSVLFMVLSVLTKENVYLISFLYGLYLVRKRKPILGSIIALTSLVIFFLLMKYFIPGAHGGPHFALNYLSQYGDSPTTISLNIFLKPQITIPILFSPPTFFYVLTVLAPTGFLSILSPLYLIFALPTLFINLLSNNSNLQNINYQYTSTIIPFTYISTIYAIAFLLKKKIFFVTKRTVFYYLLFWIMGTAWLYGVLPGANHPSLETFNKSRENKVKIMQIINAIPKNTILSTTNNLGAALSHRRGIFVMPQGTSSAQLLLFLPDDGLNGTSNEAKWARMFMKDPQFLIVYKFDNFLMLKRADRKMNSDYNP